MKKIVKILLFLNILIPYLSCTTFNTKPIVKRQNLVLLSISDQVYPDSASNLRKEVLPPIEFPKWNEKTIMKILGNIKYKRFNVWGDTIAPIYSYSELQSISKPIEDAITSIKTDQRLVVINRYDPDASILSKTHMNSLLFWVDEAGVNLVFGVIHEEIPGDDFHDNSDWDSILPISFKASFRDLEIMPADFLTFKKIDGIKHKTWVIIPLDKVDELEYKIELVKKGKQNNTKKETKKKHNKKDPTSRLRKLKQAHEDGLITDDEYINTRQSILKDF